MKTFKLIVTENAADDITVESYNDGFNASEIIVFLEYKKQDIVEQIRHPEKFKHVRTGVVDGEHISVEEVKAGDFQIGDKVYADDWCYGEIVRLEDDIAWVEFETAGGGGTAKFNIANLRKE